MSDFEVRMVSTPGSRAGHGTLGTVDSGFHDCDQPETASDIDESELRRELLNDKWRILFDKYDPEGFGEIPWEDFVEVLKSPEFIAEVDVNKREILAEKAQEGKTSAITFQDFVNVTANGGGGCAGRSTSRPLDVGRGSSRFPRRLDEGDVVPRTGGGSTATGSSSSCPDEDSVSSAADNTKKTPPKKMVDKI